MGEKSVVHGCVTLIRWVRGQEMFNGNISQPCKIFSMGDLRAPFNDMQAAMTSLLIVVVMSYSRVCSLLLLFAMFFLHYVHKDG